jgi:hypothetical protein
MKTEFEAVVLVTPVEASLSIGKNLARDQTKARKLLPERVDRMAAGAIQRPSLE